MRRQQRRLRASLRRRPAAAARATHADEGRSRPARGQPQPPAASRPEGRSFPTAAHVAALVAGVARRWRRPASGALLPMRSSLAAPAAALPMRSSPGDAFGFA